MNSRAPSDALPLPPTPALAALEAECQAATSVADIAQRYGFATGAELRGHALALSDPHSVIARFERAADAIVAGDESTLKSLLRTDVSLVTMRSTRVHRATLLHYVSANGVENFRQFTPANILEITEFLLAAGARVDEPDAMGHGTTLGLVASSYHPLRRGVQNPLIDLLLDAGAAPDGHAHGWKPILAALRNGRGEAAFHLSERGATLDLESAAGVGHLDKVRSYFDEHGALQHHATAKQCIAGFHAACQYGRLAVVEFLLTLGMDLRAGERTSQTALHWAVLGGQVPIIRCLLQHGAPLEAVNAYGGTVLGLARWCQTNGNPNIDYAAIAQILLDAGATPR